MKPELIVAFDMSSSKTIFPLLKQMPDEVRFAKVGLELFAAEGPAVIGLFKTHHKSVFLDLKLHDIPNTVARAVTSAAKHGVDMLTVHASGGRGMLKAAVDAAKSFGHCPPKIVAVTALTSLNQNDLADIGIHRSMEDHVKALAEMAVECGVDGLVTSVNEAGVLRHQLGPSVLLVTPGIRPMGKDMGDQKRVATPAMAVKAGSSFLVVGRPILEAPDPRTAAIAILKEMQSAMT